MSDFKYNYPDGYTPFTLDELEKIWNDGPDDIAVCLRILEQAVIFRMVKCGYSYPIGYKCMPYDERIAMWDAFTFDLDDSLRAAEQAIISRICNTVAWKSGAMRDKLINSDSGYQARELYEHPPQSDIVELTVHRDKLISAAKKVIKMERQMARDKYGDAEKAEQWSSVILLRKAIANQSVDTSKRDKLVAMIDASLAETSFGGAHMELLRIIRRYLVGEQ